MQHKPLLIYLADDDEEDSMLFKEALQEVDITTHVEVFNNGVTLMDKLLTRETSLPDAIYLDLNMPLMNGKECLDDIRNEPQFSKTPIIIYSTYIENSLADKLKNKGANWFIIKPNSFTELKSLLQKSLERTFFSDSKNMSSLEGFIIA